MGKSLKSEEYYQYLSSCQNSAVVESSVQVISGVAEKEVFLS